MIKKSLEITPGIEPLYGTRDENLRLMEDSLGVTIDLRSDAIEVTGNEAGVVQVERIFTDYEALRRGGVTLQNGELKGMLKLVIADPTVTLKALVDSGRQRSTGVKRMVQPRSPNQRKYVEAIEQSDMIFEAGAGGHGRDVSCGGDGGLGADGEEGESDHPGSAGKLRRASGWDFCRDRCRRRSIPGLRPLYDALYDLLDPAEGGQRCWRRMCD